jgi:O-antigen ligase
MTFINQFSGKVFRWILFGLIALDILSFIALHSTVEPFLAIAVLIGVIGLAFKSPSFLFPLAMAEIISTSNGHSLNLTVGEISIGIRILIFVVLMIVTAFHVYKYKSDSLPSSLILPSVLVVVLILFSVIQGFVTGNAVSDIYKDANGYLAIGYVWAAFVWTRSSILKHRLLQAVGAGVVWIVAKSLLFVFIFGHLHPVTLEPIYLWIRDTRLGEVTLQLGNVYRVFLQSQWFIVPALLLSGSYMIFGDKNKESGVRILIIVLIAVLIASLSRSFWVGAIAGIVTLLCYTIIRDKVNKFGKSVFHIAILSVTSVALLWILIAIPIFQTSSTNIFASILKDRATQSSDVALDSRKQLLSPMLEAIGESSVAGHGLGKNVTYQTQDPRYIAAHDTDIVSTYAFEWGWLDIMVKFGIVGFVLILILILVVLRSLHMAIKIDKARSWLYIGLAASIIALIVTHAFSPYLNHPIGWATIAIVVAMLPAGKKKSKTVNVDRSSKPSLSQVARPGPVYLKK